MDADVMRDIVRKTILQLIKNGCTRYTDIEKYASMKCENFASRNVVIRQFYKYLIAQRYVERIGWGRYRLTKNGEDMLTVLSSVYIH